MWSSAVALGARVLIARRANAHCGLNESRWTARGVSSRLRYDPARVADSAAEKANRVARAAPAIVWVACPAGVVGANTNVLLRAYSRKR